ncbi:MAG: dockerin type I repeat-containing protein [Ruminococcus sp.]|nr:dockerin type I repeat-containing protein [Ruminococcus sp.]
MKKLKVILSAGIALCIGVSSVTTAFAAEPFTYYKIGDFDSNKKVDVSDVTTLQMQLAGYEVMEIGALDMADLNGDGYFDVSDVTDTQKMVAGLDYDCFITADESYKDITRVLNCYPTEENAIDFEVLYNTRDLIFKYMPSDGHEHSGNKYLIKNKEQFYAVFNVYSPEFDDEYFEENALFVFLQFDYCYNKEYHIKAMGVENNTLCVRGEHYVPYVYEEALAYWHIFCKVKQEDVKNVDTISYSAEYVYEEK